MSLTPEKFKKGFRFRIIGNLGYKKDSVFEVIKFSKKDGIVCIDIKDARESKGCVPPNYDWSINRIETMIEKKQIMEATMEGKKK